MDIGLVREVRAGEARVALTPAATHSLVEDGHRLFVETGAGTGAGFSDEDYAAAGGQIVYNREDAIRRAEIITMVQAPIRDDYETFEDEQVVYAFLLLAVQPRDRIADMVSKRITAIGMEIVANDQGEAPIQDAMSQIGGPLAVEMAARFLKTSEGGRGILLGGLPGTAPAHIVILGGGAVGWAASRSALGMGAQVTVFDVDAEVLNRLHNQFGGRAVTRFAHTHLLDRLLPTADALVGAASVHGERAPAIISRKQVARMKPGAVIVDVAIDTGGCVATSRPTTIEYPTYVEENVIHCCIPNLPALAARTSSYVLANASLPYLRRLAGMGPRSAIVSDPGLAAGVYIDRGDIKIPGIRERMEKAGAADTQTGDHG